MRQIHPVGFKEKFVASGIYTYTDAEANEPLGITENWSIHRLPDDAHIIRADWDARAEQGESRIVEAFARLDGGLPVIERFDVIRHLDYADDENHFPKETRATYVFANDHVQISQTLDLKDNHQAELPLPFNFLVDPKVNITRSYIVRLAQLNKTEIPVFRLVRNSRTRRLGGMIEDCQATMLGNDTLTIDGKPQPATHYRLECSESDHNPHCWFDERNILLRYQQTNLVVSLSSYARSPQTN